MHLAWQKFKIAYDMGTVQDNALAYRIIQKAKKAVADGLPLHSDQRGNTRLTDNLMQTVCVKGRDAAW